MHRANSIYTYLQYKTSLYYYHYLAITVFHYHTGTFFIWTRFSVQRKHLMSSLSNVYIIYFKKKQMIQAATQLQVVYSEFNLRFYCNIWAVGTIMVSSLNYVLLLQPLKLLQRAGFKKSTKLSAETRTNRA